jgi:hypothetical protein
VWRSRRWAASTNTRLRHGTALENVSTIGKPDLLEKLLQSKLSRRRYGVAHGQTTWEF